MPKNTFEGVVASWSKPGREKDPSAKCVPPCVCLCVLVCERALRMLTVVSRFTGELATSLPGYAESLSLKVVMQLRERGKRPLIDVQPSDNPLSAEQRQGVSVKRLREICTAVMRRDA